MIDVRRHDRRAAQPVGIGGERCEQQLVVGAVEARRGEHAVRNPVAIENADEFVDRDITLRRRMPLGRERKIAQHHVRVAIDGGDGRAHRMEAKRESCVMCGSVI